MKSKFKIVSYFIPIFFLFLIYFIFSRILNIEEGFNTVVGAYLVHILLITSTLLVIFEMKYKIIIVQFKLSSILINSFFGFGKTSHFIDNEIEGFQTSIIRTNFGEFDFIYLICKGKKVAKISNQYHKNFNELSQEIKSRYKDLGYVNSGFKSEIKDVFN